MQCSRPGIEHKSLSLAKKKQTSEQFLHAMTAKSINAPKVQIPGVEMPKKHVITANCTLKLLRLKKKAQDILHNCYNEKLI